MAISKDREELYENMPDCLRDTIDEAYTRLYNFLGEQGLTVSQDDRAENLVGAIARYVKDSGNF